MLVLSDRRILGLAVLVMAGWMIACSSGNEAPAPVTSGLPKLDAGAYLACRQFADVIQEQRDGVLNDAELRARLKAVYERARTWPNSDVTKASAAVVRDITERSPRTFWIFAREFSSFQAARGRHVKTTLQQVKALYEGDSHLKPSTAEEATADLFKVTFYEVEKDATGTPYLVKKSRAIPNEGEPRTPRFGLNEGASGRAWADKKTVVCALGGKDKDLFKPMWTGQGDVPLTVEI